MHLCNIQHYGCQRRLQGLPANMLGESAPKEKEALQQLRVRDALSGVLVTTTGHVIADGSVMEHRSQKKAQAKTKAQKKAQE